MDIKNNIYFKDRYDAANQLISVLPIEKMKLEEWTVIALSYGGYEIAKIVSKTLNAKLDILFSEKILAPQNNECEIAIVTEQEDVVINEELASNFGIDLDYIYLQSKKVYETCLLRKVAKFRYGEKIDKLENKNVLIIDEGINTGLSMMAAMKTVINLKAKSISVATPILPTSSIKNIEAIADELFFIKELEHFVSIDFYYNELENLEFEDLEKIK